MFLKTKNRHNRKKGFTLIELLVVISIISLLSSIILSSLTSARAKTRDAARVSDIRQMRNALELYYSTNNSYPVINSWATSNTTSLGVTGTNNWTTLQTVLSPFIGRLPNDPKGAATYTTAGPWITSNYTYAYASDGSAYDLLGQLENLNNPNACLVKKWRNHQAYASMGIGSIENSWCDVVGIGLSTYLIADH